MKIFEVNNYTNITSNACGELRQRKADENLGQSSLTDFQKINYPIYSNNIFLSLPAPCPLPPA
ncbi:MAG: hypothetical protein RMZ43_017810 [Nostoc sp. CmiVER01]|uniref:hypothetical protein n=1 Tax=Nostoc sp. CmiVER01 TaxID=3075384 RepID=UPI003D1621FE